MFIKKWHEKKAPKMYNLNFYIVDIIQIGKGKKNYNNTSRGKFFFFEW